MKYNNTKNNKKQYHQLTRDQRAKIEFMVHKKDNNDNRIYSNADIAREINVHRSTITRELRRIKSSIIIRSGKIKNKPYNVEDAQADKDYKRALSNAKYIFDKFPKLKKYIEDKILIDKWAPDVIAGYIQKNELYLKNGFTSIATSTIYRGIHLGLLKVKKKDTRRMEKFEKSGKYCKKKELPINKLQYSIELRPESIKRRENIGHWELDTVVSTNKGVHKCLMTLTERKSRFEIIIILEAKSKDEVVLKFKKLKKYLNKAISKIFKSITTDNGTEFSNFLEIIKITEAKIYFCHPYASCEKGTNEKHNGIIRYFIPKGELIENYSFKDINDIASWMNNYPRKKLNYYTPSEVLKKELNNDKLYNKIIEIQKKINK